jgi:APA family basic amino acid/polyamine antiporter
MKVAADAHRAERPSTVPHQPRVDKARASSAARRADGVSVSSLAPELQLFDAVAIVVGTIIGSAIFLIPNGIATDLSSLRTVLIVWVVGGILSLFGALSLAELGGAFPGAGGLYVYLRQVYGRPTGFLYGWALLTMIHSGSIAALAVAFSLFVTFFLQMEGWDQRIVGVVSILTLTFVNCLGIHAGKLVQNAFAVAKVVGLAAMILLLFFFTESRGTLVWNLRPDTSPGVSWIAIGTGLVAVLWAYEGWHVVSFAAGEMKRPQRDLPKSLVYGTLIVVVIYLAANIAYYATLSHAEIRESSRVAVTAMERALGPTATASVSLLIVLSIFGSMNGMILTGPRVYYAMAHDGLFFEAFGDLHRKSRVPVKAIIIQGIWTSLLVFVGSYEQLFTSVIFISWLFYGLAAAGVIILRFTRPDLSRPFRVPGFPLLPLSFCLAAIGIVVSSVVAEPKHGVIAAVLMFAGLPIYWLVLWQSAASAGKLSVKTRGVK